MELKMGIIFYDLTDEELCELMCGNVDDEDNEKEEEKNEIN